MNEVCFRMTLDVNEPNSQFTLPLHQGEVGRKIYFNLTENGIPMSIPDTAVAYLSLYSSDGSYGFTNKCDAIDSDRISYTVKERDTTNCGVYNCELTVYTADDRSVTICAAEFVTVVDARVAGKKAGEVLKGMDISILDDIGVSVATANSAASAASKAATDAGLKMAEIENKVGKAIGDIEEAQGIWVAENIKWESEENIRKKNESIRIANEKNRIAADKARQKWVAPVIEKTIENWLDETVSDGGLSSIDFNRLTPQMFGAVGDGETDDSEAIQRMINAAKPGTKIVFPEGEYLIHPYASEGYRYSKETGSTIRVGNRNKNNDGTDSVYADFAYHFAIEKGSEWMAGSDIYGMFGVILYQKKDLEIVFEPGAKLKSVAISVDNPIVGTTTYPNVNYVRNNVVVGQGDAKVVVNSNQSGAYFFYLNKCENITIQGGEFIGDIDDLPVDEDGNPIDLSIENPVQNIYGLPIMSCESIKVVGAHSRNWRFSPIHIGGNPTKKSNNITIDGCVCHDSNYHALVVEGADNVTVRNTKAYRADTGKGSVFGTSLDCEGLSETTLNENITIEGCEFGYSVTNSLNIINSKNVTVRNCTIVDKPLGVQSGCYNIDIAQNKILDTNISIIKYALDGINIKNNRIKNGQINFTAVANSNYNTKNLFITNNLIELEDDIYSVADDGKRVYVRNNMSCIYLSLKNNSCVTVANNTIVMNNGRAMFMLIESSSDDSKAVVNNNNFIVGCNNKPVTDMYYILFRFNRANVDFLYNKIDIYGAETLTALNDDNAHNASKPNLLYLMGSQGATSEHFDIGYNKFNILTPALGQPYYILTSGTPGVSNNRFCDVFNNVMCSNGVSNAYSFSTYKSYTYNFYNNIITAKHTALFTNTDSVNDINNILNGALV